MDQNPIQIRNRIQSGEVMEELKAYVKIIINRITNQVITQVPVRTSILLVDLHEKPIADTSENLFESESEKIYSDPRHCQY
jgi:hypothetical protein